MKDSIKPVLKAGRTKAQIQNQGYTYNESGFTYNQSGWQYGGIYEHDSIPIISRSRFITPTVLSTNVKPSLKVGRTNKTLEEQGYTYNQNGFIYNQLGWAYGGTFEQDIYPLISSARFVKPRNIIGMDFGAIHIPPTPPGGNSGMLRGMLGMTYP